MTYNNIYRFFLIALLFFLFGCEEFSLLERDNENLFFHHNIDSSLIDEPTNGAIKIITLNMKMGFCQNCDPFGTELGGDPIHLDKIINFFKSQNPDIICLQEVGHNFKTSIIDSQINYIASGLDMNYAFGINTFVQTKGIMGNAILSKFPIKTCENPITRYVDYNNQNHALITELSIGTSESLIVLNTHFVSGGKPDEKEIQLNRILNLTVNNEIPTIVAGDFNIAYTPGNVFLSKLDDLYINSLDRSADEDQIELIREGTFISGAILDYVFISKDDYSIRSAALVPEEYRNISDHFAYIVEVVKP